MYRKIYGNLLSNQPYLSYKYIFHGKCSLKMPDDGYASICGKGDSKVNNLKKLRTEHSPLLTGGAMLLAVCVLLATSMAAPKKTGSAPAKGSAAAKFKNIKVLKNLPAEQLMPIMRKVSASLGERCSFCHMEGNFASDAKPEKIQARQMMIMTGDINTRYRTVNKAVTCFTCHHGHAQPEKSEG